MACGSQPPGMPGPTCCGHSMPPKLLRLCLSGGRDFGDSEHWLPLKQGHTHTRSSSPAPAPRRPPPPGRPLPTMLPLMHPQKCVCACPKPAPPHSEAGLPRAGAAGRRARPRQPPKRRAQTPRKCNREPPSTRQPQGPGRGRCPALLGPLGASARTFESEQSPALSCLRHSPAPSRRQAAGEGESLSEGRF